MTETKEKPEKRLWNFIKAIAEYTENYDDFCDCDRCVDGDDYGSHTDTCQTVNFRRDEHYALTGEKPKW